MSYLFYLFKTKKQEKRTTVKLGRVEAFESRRLLPS